MPHGPRNRWTVAVVILPLAALVAGCSGDAAPPEGPGEATAQTSQAISEGTYHVTWGTAGLYATNHYSGSCWYVGGVIKDYHAGHRVYVTGERKDCGSGRYYAWTGDSYGNYGWVRVDALAPGP